MKKNQLSLYVFTCSIALLCFALVAEYFFKLMPCSLCLYQRYTYILLAVSSFAVIISKKQSQKKLILYLCAIIALGGSVIAFYHSGVEKGIFSVPLTCIASQANNMPLCNEVTFSFLGLSMASWNSIISLSIAVFILFNV